MLVVVKEWDRYVRKINPNAHWFAHFSPDTGEIDPNKNTVGKDRASGARKDLRNWFSRIDLTYHSPHKLRHGHAIYGIKLAKDIREYKAISQNLMHSSIVVTDQVYGGLSELDIEETITTLGITGLGEEDKIQQRFDAIDQKLSELMLKETHS